MQIVIKKPFEVLVLLLIIYYSLIVIIFEPVSVSVKTDFVTSAFGVWLIFLVLGFAFRKELELAKVRLFNIFLTKSFSGQKTLGKVLTLILLSYQF